MDIRKEEFKWPCIVDYNNNKNELYPLRKMFHPFHLMYLKSTKILLFLTGKLYRFNRTLHSYRKCILKNIFECHYVKHDFVEIKHGFFENN